MFCFLLERPNLLKIYHPCFKWWLWVKTQLPIILRDQISALENELLFKFFCQQYVESRTPSIFSIEPRKLYASVKNSIPHKEFWHEVVKLYITLQRFVQNSRKSLMVLPNILHGTWNIILRLKRKCAGYVRRIWKHLRYHKKVNF